MFKNFRLSTVNSSRSRQRGSVAIALRESGNIELEESWERKKRRLAVRTFPDLLSI